MAIKHNILRLAAATTLLISIASGLPQSTISPTSCEKITCAEGYKIVENPGQKLSCYCVLEDPGITCPPGEMVICEPWQDSCYCMTDPIYDENGCERRRRRDLEQAKREAVACTVECPVGQVSIFEPDKGCYCIGDESAITCPRGQAPYCEIDGECHCGEDPKCFL